MIKILSRMILRRFIDMVAREMMNMPSESHKKGLYNLQVKNRLKLMKLEK